MPELDDLEGALDRAAAALEDRLIQWRRHIHQHPELSNREERTAAFVARVLDHPCVAELLPFEDVQRSAEIKRRRQALLDAGAPLTEETLGEPTIIETQSEVRQAS